MQDLRLKSLWLLLPLPLLALPFWSFAEIRFILLGLYAVLVACLIHHYYWMEQLRRWLKHPTLAGVPTGQGTWAHLFAALYQELRNQSRSQGELTLALERFQQAAKAIPDGVVVLDDNRISWCNPPAEIMLGVSLLQDIGQPLFYLVRQRELLDYLNAQETPEPVRMRSLRNPQMTLQIQSIPFGTNQKLLLCRDISQMEKLDIVRRDFIANVSHELRTPLTVVGGFLEALEDTEGGLPQPIQQYFQLMQEQTNRMKRLVEDLLTLSKLESNESTLTETHVNISRLLEMLLREGQDLSQSHHTLRLSQDSTLNLRGAEEELYSAFGNLISNAIRYTPQQGTITLEWALRGDEAVFSVTDSGCGIEEQHIPRLTERFYRVDSGRSRATGGTGLGLSIVKHILTRHQGRLEIQSEINKGSVFRAVFPAGRVILADTPIADTNPT